MGFIARVLNYPKARRPALRSPDVVYRDEVGSEVERAGIHV